MHALELEPTEPHAEAVIDDLVRNHPLPGVQAREPKELDASDRGRELWSRGNHLVELQALFEIGELDEPPDLGVVVVKGVAVLIQQ